MDPTPEATQIAKEANSNRIWVYDSLNNWVCLEDPVVEAKPEATKEDTHVLGEQMNTPQAEDEPIQASTVKETPEGEKKEEEAAVTSEEQKDVYTLIQKFDIVQKKKLYQHDTLGLAYVQSLKNSEADVLTA